MKHSSSLPSFSPVLKPTYRLSQFPKDGRFSSSNNTVFWTLYPQWNRWLRYSISHKTSAHIDYSSSLAAVVSVDTSSHLPFVSLPATFHLIDTPWITSAHSLWCSHNHQPACTRSTILPAPARPLQATPWMTSAHSLWCFFFSCLLLTDSARYPVNNFHSFTVVLPRDSPCCTLSHPCLLWSPTTSHPVNDLRSFTVVIPLPALERLLLTHREWLTLICCSAPSTRALLYASSKLACT